MELQIREYKYLIRMERSWAKLAPCKMATGEGCIDPDGPGPLKFGDGQFSKPEHASVDPEGNVFVVDIGNKRIQVFAPVTN